MEKCTNGEKHVFYSSWGSMPKFCGLCICTRSVEPRELREALDNNECYAETMLIQQLEYHSNPANFKPRRRAY